MADRSYVQNDTWPPMRITLKATDPADGVLKVVDLTNAQSARLLMRPKQGSGLIVSALAFQTDRTTGRLTYTPVAADTAAVAVYALQVEVKWDASKTQTFPLTDTLTITEDYG